MNHVRIPLEILQWRECSLLLSAKKALESIRKFESSRRKRAFMATKPPTRVHLDHLIPRESLRFSTTSEVVIPPQLSGVFGETRVLKYSDLDNQRGSL